MKVMFGICSWGLGHATRTLPIIRRFVRDGEDVIVVSYGRALNLLRNELGDSVKYVELADYPPPTTARPRMMALDTLLSSPKYLHSMYTEHRFVEKSFWGGHVDVVFSDNRYGFYSLRVPSYFMTHQLRIMNPLFLRSLEAGSEVFNRWFLNRYTGVIVPDFKENGLAGRLDHGLSVIEEDDLNYVGVLSDFERRSSSQEVDLFVSISGAEPHRTSFERLVRKQLENYKGRAVVSLGRPAETEIRGRVRIQGMSSRETQEDLLNGARVVVARAGYSTIMDVCALGKRSLLVPTPGQTEQEYLASYHMSRGSYYCVDERALDIKHQLDAVMRRGPPVPQHSPEQAVENTVGIMTGTSNLI
jgi:hypothetical protein